MQQIFVFGSNTAGRHGKGAALVAKEKWGAVQGIGEGLTGNAYALPTKKQITTKGLRKILVSLDIDSIHLGIERFTNYAKNSPQYHFLVTEIGCGLAGYSRRQIAPLFTTAAKLDNVFLPERFLEVLSLPRNKMSFDRDHRNMRE